MCSSLLFTAYRTIASNVSILRARAIYSDIGQRMTLSRSSRPICRCGYEDKLPLPGGVLSRNRHLQHIMMQGQPKFAPESQTLLVIHQHIELNAASTLSGEFGKSRPRKSLSIATSSKRRSNVQVFDEPRGLLGETAFGHPKTAKAGYLFLHTSQPEAMPPSRCSLRDRGNPPVHRFLSGFLRSKFAIVLIGQLLYDRYVTCCDWVNLHTHSDLLVCGVLAHRWEGL